MLLKCISGVIIVIFAAPTKNIRLQDPNGYVNQIGAEIDAVLQNLHTLNEVFISAKLKYDGIFYKLRKANPSLLEIEEGLAISVREEGKYNIFAAFLYKNGIYSVSLFKVPTNFIANLF